MDISIKGQVLYEFTYQVERCKIKELAQAIGDPNPLYVDREAARAQGYDDVIAPPTFGTLVNLWGGVGFLELMAKIKANPLKILHAEQEYEYLGLIHPGDTLQAVIEVADIFSKQGSKGEIKFCVLQTTSTNQHGEKVLVGRSTLVERG